MPEPNDHAHSDHPRLQPLPVSMGPPHYRWYPTEILPGRLVRDQLF